MVPLIIGAEGAPVYGVIITSAETAEIHPCEFVTVKLYVPAGSNEIVVLEPDPAIAPGLIVQLPEGRPVNTILPVASSQVG